MKKDLKKMSPLKKNLKLKWNICNIYLINKLQMIYYHKNLAAGERFGLPD